MDNVWFIPLQSPLTIPKYTLSDLEINTQSGSSNEALQGLRKNKLKQQVIYPYSFKTYVNTKTTEYGEHHMHTSS
jgi:glutamine synthetase